MPLPLKHIYWFAYYDKRCPSVRYRGIYPLQVLGARGIASTLVMPGYAPAQVLHFLKTYLRCLLFPGSGSVIVLQKIYTSGIYGRCLSLLARLRRRRIAFDLDDAEYLRHPDGTLKHLLRHAAMVIVGSKGLAQYAGRFNPQITLLGSPILMPTVAPDGPQAHLHLGWIGFFNNHRASIEALVIEALRQVDVPLTLTLLGVDRPHQRAALAEVMQALPHVHLRMPQVADWCDEAAIYQEIASWDWGLAPLQDTEFNRAKSAFKLKQCLAAGVPVLASPVGENAGLLTPGRDGYYFDTAQVLAQRIAQVAALPHQEHQRMRAQARVTAAQFEMTRYADRLHDTLAAICPS